MGKEEVEVFDRVVVGCEPGDVSNLSTLGSRILCYGPYLRRVVTDRFCWYPARCSFLLACAVTRKAGKLSSQVTSGDVACETALELRLVMTASNWQGFSARWVPGWTLAFNRGSFPSAITAQPKFHSAGPGLGQGSTTDNTATTSPHYRSTGH